MEEKVAKQVAADFTHHHKDSFTKIGSHVTNGVKRFVVHVTWKKPEDEGATRRKPITLADPTQAF